jgi:hypothetical protein
MLDGEWSDSDFVIAQPGQRLVPTFDEHIIAAKDLPPPIQCPA